MARKFTYNLAWLQALARGVASWPLAFGLLAFGLLAFGLLAFGLLAFGLLA